jgi:hypothetical protein
MLDMSMLGGRAPDEAGQAPPGRGRRLAPNAAQRPWFTDPAVPLTLFALCLLVGALASSEPLAWASFGALAGYSLSGST